MRRGWECRVARGRRIAGVFALLALCVLAIQCGEEPTAPGGAGSLSLDLALPSRGGPDDSLSLWIEDDRGRLLAGPARTALDPGGAFDLALEVPEGKNRVVRGSIDGFSYRERGVLALGTARGVTVRVGSTTEVRLPFIQTIPQLEPIQAAPGDLAYTVRWSKVSGASSYELFELRDTDVLVYAGAESSRVVPVGGADRATYRVRALLGTQGTGAFSDSASIDRETIFDLPRVVRVAPAPGTSGVLDRTEPVLYFDRPMDWSTLSPGAITLREVEGGREVEFTPVGERDSLRLEHDEAFRRGVELEVSIAPGVRDLDGRMLDQQPAEEGLQGFSSRFSTEVYDPLHVLSVTPEDGADSISIGSEIVIALNRVFDETTVDSETVVLEATGGAAVVSLRSIAGTEIHLDPSAPLAYDTAYTIRVTTGVLDLRGEPLDQDADTPIPIFEPFTASFRTETQPMGPSVISVFPVNGEPNAASFEPVRVEFSRPVDTATVTAATLSVQKLPIGANIPGTVSATSSTTFVFTPSNLLEAGVRYRVVVTTGVRDLEGVPLDQDPLAPGFQPYASEFQVERNVQVTSVTPANGAVRYPLEQPVSVRVSAALDPQSLTEESFRLENGTVSVPAARSLSADGRTAILTPKEPLDTFREYLIRLNSGVRAVDGGRLDQNLTLAGYQEFTSRFTTRPESLPPMVTAVLPQNGETELPLRPLIEVAFSKPVQPASVNVETFLLRRVEGGAIVTATRQVSVDSLSAQLLVGADLENGTEYEIEVATWVVDRFDVRLDQDPVTPDRQEFRSRFRTEAERVAPFVASVNPAAGAQGIPEDTSIEVTFSEPMTLGTVSAFSLVGTMGSVAGDADLSANGLTLTFTPFDSLTQNREYTVHVDTTAVDLAGNALDQDATTAGSQPFTSTFRTVGDQVGPRVIDTDPADGATDVERDVIARVDFSEPLGAVPDSAIALFDAEDTRIPLSEIRQVLPNRLELVPAALLDFDTAYHIVATVALVDTAGNALDQDPLTPELEAFRSDFRTRLETLRPSVVEVRYEGEPDRVPVESQIWLAFSEPMDIASLVTATIQLESGAEVTDLNLAFQAPDTLRITPEADLLFDAEYELLVTGLTDVVGNPLDQDPLTETIDPFVATFTTLPDTIAPRVIAVMPADGAEGIERDTAVTLVFSEPMNPLTVDTIHFQLIRIEGSLEFVISGGLTHDPTGTAFTFTPQALLDLGAFHEVRADFFLEDLAGNPLDQDPSTGAFEEFRSMFLVGSRPTADAGESVCDPLDATVAVDGSASFDPDGPLDKATWIWGDGGVTVIETPDSSSLVLSHDYSCTDLAGCDGLDNDGDGDIDAEDCDESYVIILRVEDEHGHQSADTIGVSFCSFVGLGSVPEDGATGVDTLLTEVRLEFSRPVSPSSLTMDHFRLLQSGLDTGYVDTVSAGANAREVVLTLGAELANDTPYVVWVAANVTAPSGHVLDQDPCAVGNQPFSVLFRTAGR